MDIEDVENLAELARIELSGDEKKEILSDMKGILEYVKQIEKVKMPIRQLADEKNEYNNLINVWREDKIESREFSKELILGQFPDTQDGFLKVKKIL
ncbi:MAG: Asp-tRNA(Asn)/Glu-tRNA(Gln) amidotransferase subunit GatC [Patescibacteria group bacterium]